MDFDDKAGMRVRASDGEPRRASGMWHVVLCWVCPHPHSWRCCPEFFSAFCLLCFYAVVFGAGGISGASDSQDVNGLDWTMQTTLADMIRTS